MIAIRFPVWRLSAVGSNPTYTALPGVCREPSTLREGGGKLALLLHTCVLVSQATLSAKGVTCETNTEKKGGACGYDKLFDICTACYTCTHAVHWSISPLSSSVCSALSAEREDHRRLQPRSTLLLIILDYT